MDVGRVQELLEILDRLQKLRMGLEVQLPTDVQGQAFFETIVAGCLKDVVAVRVLLAESGMFATSKLAS